MEVFLVCVVLLPTKKDKDEADALPQFVVPLQAVLAKDDAHAQAKALRLVPEEHINKDARLEVRVLPFRKAGCH